MNFDKRDTRRVITQNVLLFWRYGVNVLNSSIVRALHKIIWIIWTYTCMHKTIVGTYIIKVLDSFVTMQPLGELHNTCKFIKKRTA